MTSFLDPEIVRRLQRLAAADGEPSTSQIGRYRVVGELGRGAMGVVYDAEDPDLGRPVAIKILNQEADNDTGRERFRREALAAAAIAHPHLAKLYAVEEDRGRIFLVMERVEGVPLRRVMDDPRVPEADKVRLLRDAARGIGAAHGQGIIHRDLKPQNILVTPAGAKVVDFGLAFTMERQEAMTREGTLLGTPVYMSPEQALGRPVGPASDVHAFGVILFEMLTGRLPYPGRDAKEVVARIVAPDVPRIEGPAALARICRKALAKEPADRYPDAEALAADLDRYLAGDSVLATVPGPRRPLRWVAGLGAMALLMTAIGFAIGRPARQDPAPLLRQGRTELLAWLQEAGFAPFDDAGLRGWRPIRESAPRREAARAAIKGALRIPGTRELSQAASLVAAVEAADRMMSSSPEAALAKVPLAREALGPEGADRLEALAAWQARKPGAGLEAARRLKAGAGLAARIAWLLALEEPDRAAVLLEEADEAASRSGDPLLLCVVRRTRAERIEIEREAHGRRALEALQASEAPLSALLRGSVLMTARNHGEALREFGIAQTALPRSAWPGILAARTIREMVTANLLSPTVRFPDAPPLEAAFEAVGDAIRRDGDNAEAWHERANLHFVKKLAGAEAEACFEAAISDLRRAIGLEPGEAAYWCALGEAWRKRAQDRQDDRAGSCLAKALEAYDEAVRLRPDSGATHLGLAAVREQRALLPGVSPADAAKWLQLAEQSATEAIRCTGTAGGYYFRRAMIRRSMAALASADPLPKLDEADGDFKAALQRNPTLDNVRIQRALALEVKAQALRSAGRTPFAAMEEAVDELSAVIRRNPGDAEAVLHLASLRLRMAAWRPSEDPERRVLLESARNGLRPLPPSYAVLSRLGLCEMELGNRAAAIEALEGAQRLRGPADPDLAPLILQLRSRE